MDDFRADGIRERLSALEVQVSTLRTKVAQLRGTVAVTFTVVLCLLVAFVVEAAVIWLPR
jgi:hypothetical protein